MSREYNQKAKDYYPRVSQISLIIFSAQKDNYENKLFTSIINELLQKIISLEKNSEDFSFNWSKVSLDKLSSFKLD